MSDNPRLIMMCGLPGSGKSTYAKKYIENHEQNWKIHSSDELREELFGDINWQDNNNEVFAELHRRIVSDLSKGVNVIYDACNVSRKKRKAFFQTLKDKKVECYKECWFMAVPFEECVRRNNLRDRKIPTCVIDKMYRGFNVPWECDFQNVRLVNRDKAIGEKWSDFVGEHLWFNQDNPHHQLTLGNHLMKTNEHIVSARRYRSVLLFAASIHDCGKPYTKTFKNCKGEECDTAHYYSHENVGAYDVLSGKIKISDLTEEDILDIATLVEFHMRPYVAWKDSEKAHTRDKKELGYLYDLVLRLHEADVAAH